MLEAVRRGTGHDAGRMQRAGFVFLTPAEILLRLLSEPMINAATKEKLAGRPSNTISEIYCAYQHCSAYNSRNITILIPLF